MNVAFKIICCAVIVQLEVLNLNYLLMFSYWLSVKVTDQDLVDPILQVTASAAATLTLVRLATPSPDILQVHPQHTRQCQMLLPQLF